MLHIEDNSIHLIYKPKGITSFDLIRIIRTHTNIKKIGHAGTLDPNAEGLMILGTGLATKKLTDLVGMNKTYIAEIKLGIKTDSGDIDGNIIENQEISYFDISEIRKIIEEFPGTHRLPVSLFSAIKKAGTPLYTYARLGKNIEKPIRDMTVYDAKFISYTHPVITAEFNVSSGTYIRSIAEEIAKKLGTIGTLQNLKRIKIGDYTVETTIQIPKKITEEFIQNKKRLRKS